MAIKTPIQIRFADIDMLGHVNNVNLQHYFDVGKSAWFREAVDIGTDWSQKGLITASTKTVYFEPTFMDERIYVETFLEKTGNKSFGLFQRLVSEKGNIKAESRSVLVAYDFSSGQSVPIPREWSEKMIPEELPARSV